MLVKLILLPVIFVIALAIGVVLNAALRRKRIQWLPEKHPRFCILPKYCMKLDLTGPKEDWEDEVHQRITSLGFEVTHKNDDFQSYERGHDFADFSAEAVRVAIVVRRPITNPTVIGLQYASKLGVAFDTGDLWKVADSIRNALTPPREDRSYPPKAGDVTVSTSRRDTTLTLRIRLFAIGCMGIVGLGVLFTWIVASSNRIHAGGNLQPIVQQDVRATEDAIIETIFVGSGEFVQKGTALLALRSKELESQHAELVRQIEAKQRSLSARQTQLLSRDLTDEQRIRLAQEAREQKSSIEASKNELNSVKELIEQLTVQSPIDGEIIATAAELVSGRPVTRGDYLMTIADPSGPWGLTLQLDEAQTGSLVRANASASEPLAVEFQLGTDSRWGHGVVTNVSRSTNAPGMLAEVEIDVANIPPELLIPGTTARAVILLKPN